MLKYLFPLIAIFLFVSCNQPEDKTLQKSVFRYNESKGIPSLDPAFARSLPVIWPTNQLFNGLVQLDDSLHIKPCIAQRWSISGDGLSYTFHLRTDVFFHNSPVFHNGKGRRVVAKDFVFSFSRIMSSETASPGAWIFSALRKEGHNPFEIINDSVLTIHLVKPFPPFLGLLSMPYAFVVPQEATDFYGKEFGRNPVGTGPFFFKFWREGEKLIFLKNENYFEYDNEGFRLPYIDAVNISFIADKQSEFLEFLLGKIDFISGVHATSRDELLTRSGNLNPKYSNRIQMLVGPYLNTEYLGIHQNPAVYGSINHPLQNPFFRKAIAHGIDKGKMITYLRNNLAYPASQGFIPFGMPSFNPNLKGYQYNQFLARDYLTKAGYPDGKGLQPITITTTDDYVDICEFIQHQLSEIGIVLKIDVMPGAAYRELMANSKLQFFRASWVADYADAENYLSLFHSSNLSPTGPNYTHFTSSNFDRMLESSQLVSNHKQRYALYNSMDSVIIEEIPVIPLFYDKVVRFVGFNVNGLGINPMNLLVLKRVKKQ